MNEWKDFFRFTRREQAGVVALLSLIALLLLFISLNGFFVKKQLFEKTIHDTLLIVNKLSASSPQSHLTKAPESDFNPLNAEKSMAAVMLKPFPFNPNQLPEDQWLKMGLTDKQVRNIKNYEAKGGKFYKKEDLSKIFSISKEEFQLLEPFIEIPTDEPANSKTRSIEKELLSESRATVNSTGSLIVELNTADSLTLEAVPHIGAWTAHRILKYRASLGGFVRLEQLREVNGLDQTKWDVFIAHLRLDSTLISPLKINRLTFKALLKHSYLEYEHTKGIVNYRETKGFIRDLNTFGIASGLDPLQIERIKPYLSFE